MNQPSCFLDYAIHRLPSKQFSTWKIDNNIIHYHRHVYVPQNEELRNDIIKSHHDPVIMGHPGCLKTLELIHQDYYWPGMTSTISKWVKGCALCQQMKVNTHPTAPGIMPIKSHATRPHAHSNKFQWTSSQIYRQLTDLTLF